MTGYGQARGAIGEAQVSVTIKTLNGRYLDVRLRTPPELSALEPAVCRRLEKKLHRGRVEVSFTLQLQSSSQFEINRPLVENYLAGAEVVRHLGAVGELTVASVLALPGVLAPREQSFQSAEVEAQLAAVVDEALGQVLEARESEGAALRVDIGTRLDSIEDIVGRIEPFAGEITEHYRRKLEEKIKRLGDSAASVEAGRLAQEVIFYSEKADISEELTRLRTHLESFREALGEARGSVGKNLDFLCQELNRETNTIVSKSPSPEISALGVEAKVEIEKVREQVQNVE